MIDDQSDPGAWATHIAHTPHLSGSAAPAIPSTPSVNREDGEARALVDELRPLVEKASRPNGWDWMFPIRVVPVDGKPTIAAHKGGNLFRGYIGTWEEADLLVALANAAPRILAALSPSPVAADRANDEQRAALRAVIGKALDTRRGLHCEQIAHVLDAVTPFMAFASPVAGGEVERLREALEPFARYADAILKRRDGAQDEPVAVDRLVFGIDGQHVTIGDLRRARTALSREPRS